MNHAGSGVTMYWAQVDSSFLQGEWWPFLFPASRLAATVAALVFILAGVDEVAIPAAQGPQAAWTVAQPVHRRPAHRRRGGGRDANAVLEGGAPAPAVKRETLVELRELVVDYVLAGRSIRAVDHVNLSVGKGEVFGLAGESGCGKSTIAHAVTRAAPPAH